MNRHDLDRRAALARAVPLETVLVLCGAFRDGYDPSKWHTAQGPLSVTGAKFMNWARSQGGGGAIDLVMHLWGLDFRAAVEWLESRVGTGYVKDECLGAEYAGTEDVRTGHVGVGHVGITPIGTVLIGAERVGTAKNVGTRHIGAGPVGSGPVGSGPVGAAKNVGEKCESRSSAASECPIESRVGSAGADPLRLPVRDDRLLTRMHEYLTTRRKLSSALLEPVLRSGRLYADQRGNAVFLLVRGKPNQAVGAELRGTGSRVWRGMAAGSRKDLGYFWVGEPAACELVLCESAIDAMSCFQLRGSCLCLSTSGVRTNPAWLPGLIARGYRIHCGFDTDAAGEQAASQMTAHYPSVTRLRPPAHDWNDTLTSFR